jgi:hypothetical protein
MVAQAGSAPLSSRRWAILGLAAAIGLATAWFLTHYRRGTERRAIGYTGEARANPYHALRRLLEEYGAKVEILERVDGLESLPPVGGTLFLPTSRQTFPRSLTPRLREWVESGGHLIAVTWTLYEDEGAADPLLDPLDLRQFFEPDVPIGDAAEGAEGGDTADPPSEPEPGPELVRAAGHWMLVEFDARFSMADAGVPASGRIADASGTHLLWYEIGKGRLSVFTDTLFWENGAIDANDHGEFALRWFDPGVRDEVWILPHESHPSLADLFLAHAWPVGLALAALGALALWRAAPRFGPLEPVPPRGRRELGEHLDAVARSGWRWSRGAALLASVRASLVRERLRRRPELAAAGTLALHALGERLGLDAVAIERALGDTPCADPADFASRIRTLELLRKGL